MARQSPPEEVLPPSAAPGAEGREPFSEQDIRGLVGTAALDKAGHLMCERCRQPDAVLDKEVFALKMQHLVLSVKSRTLALGNVKIGDILQQVLAMVRGHHVRLEGDFVNVVISILLLEGIGRSLNPDVDLLSSSLPILRQLSTQGAGGGGDFSMILLWVGLETRKFLQASIEDVSFSSCPLDCKV